MLLVVAGLGLVSLLTGRLLVGALKVDLLRRLDPAGAAASAILGTATLVLVAVWLSEAGLPSPAVAKAIPPLLAALAVVSWRRRRIDALRVRGPAKAWAALLVPALAAALFSLLPVLRTDGYAIGNDTYTYCAYSEWLQQHGFSEPCPNDLESPVTGIPWLYQQLHYDLGIAHLLGMVQGATRSPSALLVYPPAAAWAMVLLVCALVLVGRWVLRLPWAWAGLAAFLFAVVPHAVYWGHHNGSLQQTHALPVLLLGVALLARCVSPRRWRVGTAALLAIPFAFLIVVYLPMLPVLGAAAAVAVHQAFVRARRRGMGREGLIFAGTTSLLIVVLAFRDLVGVVGRYVQLATTAPGAHIPFGVLDFVMFGAGTRVLAPGWTSVEVAPWSVVNRALTPAYLALMLVGFALAWRRGRTRGLAAVATLLLAALGYYALVARDPWTNEVGHTWSLFKLLQWAFPVVFLLGVLGLRRLPGRRRGVGRLVPVLALILPCTLLSVHWVWAGQLGLTMRDILLSERPLDELPAIRQRIQDLPPGTLLVVGRPANRHRWLGATTALLAFPRPIVGNWSASASMTEVDEARYDSLVRDAEQPGVVPIIAGFVPFQEEGIEELGGGYVRVRPTGRPLVVHVMNPLGLDKDEATGRPAFDLSERRTKVILYAPAETAAELSLSLHPYERGEGTRILAFTAEGGYDHRRVRQATDGPPTLVAPLEGRTVLRIPMRLDRGLTTGVLLLEPDQGSVDGHGRITVVQLTVLPVERSARTSVPD
jgi:hypothetical protein